MGMGMGGAIWEEKNRLNQAQKVCRPIVGQPTKTPLQTGGFGGQPEIPEVY